MKLELIFYSLLTYFISGVILYFLFGPYSLVFMTAILLLDGFLMLRYNSVSWKTHKLMLDLGVNPPTQNLLNHDVKDNDPKNI